jgi:hypothetical protein
MELRCLSCCDYYSFIHLFTLKNIPLSPNFGVFFFFFLNLLVSRVNYCQSARFPLTHLVLGTLATYLAGKNAPDT